MSFSLPPLREISTLWPALRWLLGHQGGSKADRHLLVQARLSGLFIADGSLHWKVNGRLAMRLARSALRRLPSDPIALGRILHGVGEMNARTTAEFTALLIKHLRARRPRVSFFKVLASAAACDAKTVKDPPLNAIDLAQWVSGAQFNWPTFDRAVHRIGHPDIGISPGRYGLTFAAKIIAAIEPRAIDRWIKAHRNRLRVATIASAMLPSMYDPDIFGRATLLLRSRIPALKCVAAAVYVCPMFRQSPFEDFRECRNSLIANGIDPGDATWMMAYRIKGAIHSRYWAEHQLEQAQARLRYLEANPDAAMGGRHNYQAELSVLRKQIDNASQRLSKLASDLERMLSDLAADWPSDGLSDGQMESLEYNFVSTPEIRHRLAEKLPHGPNRDSLLKTNIEQLADFIGLQRAPTDVLDVFFNADDKRFDILAPWAAQSLILLYTGDYRGVGKRTSDLVAGIAAAFESLAIEPFAAARKPERWQSAFGRAASAYVFALLVVARMPEQRRSEIERLNQLALDHVFQLLCVKNPDARSSQLLFKLTVRAVLQAGYFADAAARRGQWARAPDMPPFARALSLWASPALVKEDKALAFELFRRVAQLPLSRGERDLQISRMLTLLDLAIASCMTAGEPALIAELVAVWAEAYRDWLTVTDRWANAAEIMSAAVERDGPERSAVLAEPSFANTHCRLLIERTTASTSQGAAAG